MHKNGKKTEYCMIEADRKLVCRFIDVWIRHPPPRNPLPDPLPENVVLLRHGACHLRNAKTHDRLEYEVK